MIVLPDDDDGSETGGGPPPDPSMREWRHPSEIAAAAAAAARTPSEDALSTEVSTAQARSPLNERPLRMLIGTIAGTAIGVVSLVGLALYLVGPGDSGANLAADDQQEGPAESLASAAIINPSEDADEDASRLRTESADGDETPETEPAPETGESESPDSGITTVPGPTIEAPEEEEIKESEPRALLDPGLRPPTEEQVDGVFALNDTMLDRVGGYVAVQDLVFTSASALGGKDRVALLADEIWAEATVIGVDRITDVAVLQVEQTAGDQSFMEAAAMATVDETEYALGGPGSPVHLVVPGPGDAETLLGMVLSNEKATTAHDGTSIYGGMQTSLVQPDGSPGSAVYNDAESLVVGMIIGSSEYLTTAISISRVIDVGRSFIEHGLPAIEWLGITGSNLDSGGVTVTDLHEAGPAVESGLQINDIIVAFNTTDVINLDHLVYLIREIGAGNVVAITYLRDEQTLQTEATVGARPAEGSAGS